MESRIMKLDLANDKIAVYCSRCGFGHYGSSYNEPVWQKGVGLHIRMMHRAKNKTKEEK